MMPINITHMEMEFMGIVIFDLAGWIRYASKRALVTTMIQHEDFSISTTARYPLLIEYTH